MSNPKPQPLWELVERWRGMRRSREVFLSAGQYATFEMAADELAAALRAWAERLKDVFYVGYEEDIFDRAVEGNWVREKLLGVPAKEPDNSQSETSFPQGRK